MQASADCPVLKANNSEWLYTSKMVLQPQDHNRAVSESTECHRESSRSHLDFTPGGCVLP